MFIPQTVANHGGCLLFKHGKRETHQPLSSFGGVPGVPPTQPLLVSGVPPGYQTTGNQPTLSSGGEGGFPGPQKREQPGLQSHAFSLLLLTPQQKVFNFYGFSTEKPLISTNQLTSLKIRCPISSQVLLFFSLSFPGHQTTPASSRARRLLFLSFLARAFGPQAPPPASTPRPRRSRAS